MTEPGTYSIGAKLPAELVEDMRVRMRAGQDLSGELERCIRHLVFSVPYFCDRQSLDVAGDVIIEVRWKATRNGPARQAQQV